MPIIAIRMFYKEHVPAHFHAEHAGQCTRVENAGNITGGDRNNSSTSSK
jgi:hypothetical protein